MKDLSCPRSWHVGTTGCEYWVYLLGVFTSSVKEATKEPSKEMLELPGTHLRRLGARSVISPNHLFAQVYFPYQTHHRVDLPSIARALVKGGGERCVHRIQPVVE